VKDVQQSSSPAEITQKFIQITDEWWGSYTYRAFNISRTSTTSLEHYTTADIHSIFRVYVPKKTYSIAGQDDVQTNAQTTVHQLPSRTPGESGEYEKTMSYVIQTRQGKVIVIDGGYQTGNYDGKYLFAYLQRITGKAKPHVDAWFMTHPHADHFAAFLSVASLYASQITVDAVYHRFPTVAEGQKYHYNVDATSFQKYNDKLATHTAKLKNAKGESTPLIQVNSRPSGKCNSMFDFDEVHIVNLLTCEDNYWAIDNITTKFSGTLEENGKSYTNKP